MYNKPLPIGSVVLLKNGEFKMMILGYLKYGKKNKIDIYDYAACKYPEGFMSPELTFLFNHEQVQYIYALGYQDDEQHSFTDRLLDEFRQVKGKAF